MAGYKRVLKPKSEYVSHKRKSLTIQEEKKLVDYLMNVSYEECSYKYLLLWQLTTGMRIGETLVLDYKKDILLSENKVEIRKTQTKDENGKIIIGETTKTENGRRTLTMNNISKQIIEKALEHKIKNKDNLLFCKPDGTMHLENSINSCLKRIALKLNIGIYEDYDKKGKLVKKTDIHTHMLRGTFATRCAEAKIAPVVLKQILGHKDISVTMKYYVDVDGSFIESETDNAIQYLVDKNIFGVELPDTNVA
jgi:integrase